MRAVAGGGGCESKRAILALVAALSIACAGTRVAGEMPAKAHDAGNSLARAVLHAIPWRNYCTVSLPCSPMHVRDAISTAWVDASAPPFEADWVVRPQDLPAEAQYLMPQLTAVSTELAPGEAFARIHALPDSSEGGRRLRIEVELRTATVRWGVRVLLIAERVADGWHARVVGVQEG